MFLLLFITETGSSDKSSKLFSWTRTRHRVSPDAAATVFAESTHHHSPQPVLRRMSPVRRSSSPAPGVPGSPGSEMSPTFLCRKSSKREKRVSAPIPRTSPYGAPYFATPPVIPDSSYPAYLKNLPQFEDEIQVAPSQVVDSDSEVVRGRGIKRIDLKLPPRPIAKRRSMSVDFTP